MMRRHNAIIVLVLVVGAHVGEIANIHLVDGAVEKVAEKTLTLNHANLDNTTLRKPGQLAISSRSVSPVSGFPSHSLPSLHSLSHFPLQRQFRPNANANVAVHGVVHKSAQHPARIKAGVQTAAAGVPETRVSPFAAQLVAPDVDDPAFNGEHGTVYVSKNTSKMGDDSDSSTGRGKYFIHTFGCQMNSADSERMAGSLESMGFTDTSNPDEADVLVYNTCSIRDKSEQKVYSVLGSQARRKREDPNLRIVIAGCVAQQEGEQLIRRVPELDLVMGPQYANRIDELLKQVEQGASQMVATEPIKILEDIAQPRRDSDLTAWVNVIYGCNEHCTYCVVPGTRGKEQSRLPADIKREVYALGEAGYKEVTLLGQNIDAYGRDLPGFADDGSLRRKNTLADLLYEIHDAPGIERIRFATSHPRYFSPRLIKAIADLPKMCEYIHLPVQSGNDKVLKEMLRGYTQKKYLEIIRNIKEAIPDVSISTDLIVGFPGETEEEFQDTLRLYEQVEFDIAFTAAYSPRPHTPAGEYKNQVADLIKADRLQRLNEVVKKVAEKRNRRFLGRTLEIMVEKPNPKDPLNSVMGRSRHNKVVFFEGSYEECKKQMLHVEIDHTSSFHLSGKLVPK